MINPIPRNASPKLCNIETFSLKNIALKIVERKIAPPKTIGVTIPTLLTVKLLFKLKVKSAIVAPAIIAAIIPYFEF